MLFSENYLVRLDRTILSYMRVSILFLKALLGTSFTSNTINSVNTELLSKSVTMMTKGIIKNNMCY